MQFNIHNARVVVYRQWSIVYPVPSGPSELVCSGYLLKAKHYK